MNRQPALDPDTQTALADAATAITAAAAAIQQHAAALHARQTGAHTSIAGIRAEGAIPTWCGTSAETQISNSPGTLAGWSISSSSDTGTAQITFRDGDANGPIIAYAETAENTGGATQWLLPTGIAFVRGLHASFDAPNETDTFIAYTLPAPARP